MEPDLSKTKKFWLLISQFITVCFVIWLFLGMTGVMDLHWLKTTQSTASQPYRLAAQTALPSVVHLFSTTKSAKCSERLHALKSDNSSAACEFKNSDKYTLGSAVIVKSNGVLITNYHVIMNKTDIFVDLNDGRSLPAKVISSNPDTDLAVLKIEATNLPKISFGSLTDVQIGDSVLAIGNPFGLGKSVSMGIISAINKSGLGINKKEDFIQTDTAVNPGDSGGALINMKGQLIGINSAIYSQNKGSTGVSFAIPLWMITQELDSLPIKSID
jgi:serine protease DegQ